MKVPFNDLSLKGKTEKASILAAVEKVLDHGKFVGGPEIKHLEEKLSTLLKAKYVIGVNSGTDALILALKAHGVGHGDEVITVSHSFFATASAICMVGAAPVFVDVEEESMLMDPAQLANALSPRTKAVMPVHLNGIPCDMKQVVTFCEDNELVLIEDCAQALGAKYQNQSVGNFGTGCFSLHPLKVLNACGDAGFITTDDENIANEVRLLRNLGLKNRDETIRIASNSRLDSLQASIVLTRLPGLEERIMKREMNAKFYRENLLKVACPPIFRERTQNLALFPIRSNRRNELQQYLKAHGIGCKVHYPLPIHLQEPYRHFRRVGRLKSTLNTVQHCLSIPIHEHLTIDMLQYVVQHINHFES